LLVCISKRSPFRPIFDKFLAKEFDLLLSNEILSEYLEKLEEKASSEVANNIAEVLINARNVNLVHIYFNWNLIAHDPDDNKYVDCAVAGNATWIVSNDRHFNVLKNIAFPKIEVLKIEDFLAVLLAQE
ncbi:MAG: putative toxin-antitoxin system toxin component, PIN family, partial [Bacteroidota bacterium]